MTPATDAVSQCLLTVLATASPRSKPLVWYFAVAVDAQLAADAAKGHDRDIYELLVDLGGGDYQLNLLSKQKGTLAAVEFAVGLAALKAFKRPGLGFFENWEEL